MTRKILFIFIVLFAQPVCQASAQFNLSRYFNDNSFSLLDLTDHLTPEFTWSIKGKLQTSMNEGINEYLEGNIYRASLNLDEVIKTDSSFWPAFYYRGLCRKSSGDLKGAEHDFTKAIKLNDKKYETFVELGEIYHATKQYSKAKRAYDAAEELSPNAPMPHYLQGTLALTRGEIAKGLRNYDRCNELNPTFAPAFVARGVIKYRMDRKNPAKYLKFFDQAVEADSTYRPSFFWRGLVYIDNNQNEKGLKDWSKLIQLMPNNPLLLQIRGFLLIEMGNFEDAFVDLRKALASSSTDENKYMTGETLLNKRIDLKNAGLYLIRTGYGLDEEVFKKLKVGYCLLIANKSKQALEVIEVAEKKGGTAPTSLLKGLALEQLKLYDSALVAFNKAIALDNDVYDAHRKRAIYRYELNDIKGAYQDFMEMKRIEPESMPTYRLSGMVKSQVKDYYGCIVDLAKFIKSDSSDAEVWRIRGFCRSEVKDYKGAVEDYQKAIEVGPKDIQAYAYVLKNHLLNKDTLSGLSTLSKMDSLWPNDVEIKFSLIELHIRKKNYVSASTLVSGMFKRIAAGHTPYYKSNLLFLDSQVSVGLNKFDDGIEKMDQSIRLDPQNAEKIFYRAKLLIKQGKIKDANKDLRKLQALQYTPANEYYQKYLTQ